MSELIVSKFGGTSGADAASVAQCLELASDSMITVVSAPGTLNADQLATSPGSFGGDGAFFATKVTEQLIGNRNFRGALGEYRDNQTVSEETIQSITGRFALIVDGLGITAVGDNDRYGWLGDIKPRVMDAVRNGEDYASMLGERLQAEIYAAMGLTLLDPGRAGRPLRPRDKEAWADWVVDATDVSRRYVLPGNTWFDGQRLHTFDRGGSDISGALAAYGVGASEYHNMTDTSCLSADPRMINPERLRHIAALIYEEGRELGRNGSGLLHPAAIIPLMGTGVKTIVRDTFNPDEPGTLYTDEISDPERNGNVMAISLMKEIVFLELHEPGMSEQAGKIAAIGKAVADAGISVVDIVGHGADRQIVIVDGDEQAATAENALRHLVNGDGTVTSSEYGMLTLVGHEIGRDSVAIQSKLSANGGLEPTDTPPLTGRHSLRIPVPRHSAEKFASDTHALLIEQAV